MFALAWRSRRSAGRAGVLLALAALGAGIAPLTPAPASAQEPVLDLRGFPLDLALRYLEHARIRFEVDGDFRDPSARIVVGQEMVVEPRAVARIPVLQLFTEPRPRPEPEIVEVPVEVIREVPVEVPVEVVREVPVEVPVEVVREVPVEVVREVPVGGSRGVGWPVAAGLAAAAGMLALVGCRTLGARRGGGSEGRREDLREEEAREKTPPDKGGLPEFRAVIVDEAITSTGAGAVEEGER